MLVDKCSKCFTPDSCLTKYTDMQKSWAFCHVCDNILDIRHYLIGEFMKDDFGEFPISRISRNIIQGRIDRARGHSPWSDNLDKAKKDMC